MLPTLCEPAKAMAAGVLERMRIRTKLGAGTLLAGTLAHAGLTHAAPVMYGWTAGTVTALGVDNANGSVLGQGTLPLTAASQVSFDATALDVPSFEFADSGPSGVALFGGTGTVNLNGDTLTVTNLVVNSSASNYSSSAAGSNPYNITLNELSASGTYVITKGAATLWSGSFADILTPTLSGQIALTGSGADQTLSLNGITLGTATLGGTPITLKADVIFQGSPVPLPAGAWLLGSGLVALVGSMRRRRMDCA